MKKEISSEKCALFLRVFRIAVPCVAAVCTVLRTLSLFLFYDADIGYYSKGSVIPTVYNVIISLSILAILVFCVLFRKKLPEIEQYTVSSRCSAVFVALAFAAVTISSVLSPFSWAEHFVGNTMSVFYYGVTALYIVTPALACIYFVLYSLGKCKAGTAVSCGIGAIAYYVFVLALSYFNIYVQMNAPEKLSIHLCCVCAMILMLSEMRVMCGAPKKAMYLFSVSVSAIALNACALPTVIATFAGVFNGGEITAPDPSAYVFFALGIFAIVRLIMIDTDKE